MIGVLDSGVGGLSVLAELKKALPNQNFTFFGDTKNIPYGTKSKEEIFLYTKNILEFFLEKNIKNVVFACNTTSAVAYLELKEYFLNKINIFPLIQTSAPYAIVDLKDNDTIAVLATKATTKSKKYEEVIKKINEKINVVSIDCTGFVEIVENRTYKEKKSLDLIEDRINIAKKHNAKRIILGCTHYPYLVDIFRKIYNVDYFDPGIYLARTVKEQIDNVGQGKLEFFVSKNPGEFILSAKTFFNIENATLVNL